VFQSVAAHYLPQGKNAMIHGVQLEDLGKDVPA
jgi:hypothetical protein